MEKLARYESILHQHGLLEATTSPTAQAISPKEPMWIRSDEPEASRSGKLLAGQGKSRYIASNLWRNLGDDEMQRMFDDEMERTSDDEEVQRVYNQDPDQQQDRDDTLDYHDPLTGAFMGAQQSILHYHPNPTEAMMLWKIHVENVEPICKILHIPSTAKMIEKISQQPEAASKADECLVFAIYHFAVFTMTDEECTARFGETGDALLQKYNLATRQALVNASFLKTADMSILQAFALFLLPCRYFYDTHTYWILTGVAVRIAQRMGVHRDGEKLGLPPFEVQMRRRLFYQLLPIDGVASQMAGASFQTVPDTWDTQRPLNINDDQIWPGMTEVPKEQKGATDMIFCLARSCIGKSFARAKITMHGSGSWEPSDYQRAELVINEAESEVQDKYIRYCDVINPLHFLTMGLARCGIAAMRLQVRLPKVRNNTATDVERRDLFQLAYQILDTDAASFAHEGLKKFRWHVKPFFLFGTWDSLIYLLTSLWKRQDLFSSSEAEAAWDRVEKIFHNHDELLKPKRALYVAFGSLTLKAWDGQPQRGTEPTFIAVLRSLRRARASKKSTKADAARVSAISPAKSSLTMGQSESSEALSGLDLDLGSDFSLDEVDWTFWDQLIHSGD